MRSERQRWLAKGQGAKPVPRKSTEKLTPRFCQMTLHGDTLLPSSNGGNQRLDASDQPPFPLLCFRSWHDFVGTQGSPGVPVCVTGREKGSSSSPALRALAWTAFSAQLFRVFGQNRIVHYLANLADRQHDFEITLFALACGWNHAGRSILRTLNHREPAQLKQAKIA